MRITTWNVNGLRAALGKGLFEGVRALDTDVLCLQEIKARSDQFDTQATQNINNYFPYVTWN